MSLHVQFNEETAADLVDLLERSMEPDPQIRDPAAAQLKELQQLPGFRLVVLQTVLMPELPEIVAISGAVLLKNSFTRYFLKCQSVEDDKKDGILQEREMMKEALMDVIRIEKPLVSKVETQLLLAIAKLGRSAWPKSWDNLFPSLIEALNAPQIISDRALLCLRHLIDQLRARLDPLENNVFSFIRFLTEKICRRFAEDAAALLPHLHSTWSRTIQQVLSQVEQYATENDGSSSPNYLAMGSVLSAAHLAVESSTILRYLTRHGLPYLESNLQEDLFAVVLEAIDPLITLRSALPADSDVRDLVDEIIVLLITTPRMAFSKHPEIMFKYATPFVQFAFHILANAFDDNRNLQFEALSVHCLLFLGQIIGEKKYDENDLATLLSPESPTQEDLAEVVRNIGSSLATQFLLLSPAEMQKWENEPETFLLDEQRVEVSNLPAAGAVFYRLLSRFKSIVVPFVLDLLEADVNGSLDEKEETKLLVKESIYNLAGRGYDEAYEIIKETPFEFCHWYTNILSKEIEMESDHPHFKYFRRRLVWVLGQGARRIPVDKHDILGNVLTDICGALLSDDVVTRVTAIKVLPTAMKGANFKAHQESMATNVFTPEVFECIFNSVQSVDELQTKTSILKSMTEMIRFMGPYVGNLMDCILKYFHELWELAEEHNVMRVNLLSILTSCVKSLKYESSQLLPVLLPILDVCLKPSGALSYLLPGALTLWHVSVQSQPILSDEIAGLFPRWHALVAENFEQHAKILLQIARSYVILAPNDFMEVYGSTLANVILHLLQNPDHDKHDLDCFLNLETMVQVLDDDTLFTVFHDVFQHTFGVLLQVKDLNLERRAMREEMEAKGMDVKLPVLTNLQEREQRQADNFWIVLGRLICYKYEATMHFLSMLLETNDIGPILTQILDLWLIRLKRGHIFVRDRIVSTFSFACVIGQPDSHTSLKDILVRLVFACINEKRYHVAPGGVDVPPEQYTEIERLKTINLNDAARTGCIRTETAEAIKTFASRHGDEVYSVLQEKLPPETLEQIPL